MVMPGFTHTRSAQDSPPSPGLRTNDNFATQQATGLYAGRIYGNLGGFIQVSGDPIPRGAPRRTPATSPPFKLFGQNGFWGIAVNNTPTVRDVWNTTPGGR